MDTDIRTSASKRKTILSEHIAEIEERIDAANAQLMFARQALELALFALEAVEFVPAKESAMCPWCHAAAYVRKNIRHSETCKREIARHAIIEALGKMDEDHE